MKSLLSIFIIAIFLFNLSCSNQKSRGELLYEKNCANCHLKDGKGLGSLIPAIDQGSFFINNREKLACVIREGIIDNSQTAFTYSMPPNDELSEVDITNILNFIRDNWYTNSAQFSLPEIKKSLNDCNS